MLVNGLRSCPWGPTRSEDTEAIAAKSEDFPTSLVDNRLRKTFPSADLLHEL